MTGENIDYYSRLKQSDLIELKTVLADINNVLTFKMTIAAAKWICKYFKLDGNSKNKLLKVIDETKPNTKGFDIHIIDPIKIIVEVKCTSPVNNGGRFGSAQWNSILDDFHNLKNGKGNLPNTSKYYKFVFLMDLGDRTDQAISQLLKDSKVSTENLLRVIRHKVKEHILLLNDRYNFKDLDIDKVYLKKIKMN